MRREEFCSDGVMVVGKLLEVFKKGRGMVRIVLRSEGLSSAFCSQVSLSLSKGRWVWRPSEDVLVFVSLS